MESLSPFLWGSCIPYNMPVYPGARRKTPKPPNWLSRCRFSRIRNVKLPCVHVPLNSRIVGQQKAGREPSLGTSVRNERPVTHISSERDFCPLPFGSLASRCVFLSAYGLCDWKRFLQSTADSMRAQDFGEGQVKTFVS